MSFIASKIPWRRRSITDQNEMLSEDIGHLLSDISKDPVHTSGGFGDIYTGKHRKVGKVALKRPRISADVEDETIRRFLREADTWRGLVHPHVLPFVGIGRVNKQIYLVSPYIDNGTLVDYIKTHPDVDRARLLREASSAIAFLHASAFVHGDIKANNILVSNDVHALLCDFGLAKTAQSVTSEGMRGAGNARWQAPELWDDCPKSFESDVYSLGMMIIEVLTGSLPFANIRDNTAVMKAVLIDHRRPIKPIFPRDFQELYNYLWDIAEFCCVTAAPERPNMEVCLLLLEQTSQLQSARAETAGLRPRATPRIIPAATLRVKIEANFAVLRQIESSKRQEGVAQPCHNTIDIPSPGSKLCPWGAIVQDHSINGFPSSFSSLPTNVSNHAVRPRLAEGLISPLSASSSFLAERPARDPNLNLAVVPGVALVIDTLERIYSSMTILAYNDCRGPILTDEDRSIFRLKDKNLDGANLKEAIDKMNTLLSRIHDDIHWWNGHRPGQGWPSRNEVVLGIQAYEVSFMEIYKVLLEEINKKDEQRMEAEQLQTMTYERDATRAYGNRINEDRISAEESFKVMQLQTVVKTGPVPVSSGSTYTVWKGKWLVMTVALKYDRSFRTVSEDANRMKHLESQVNLWRRLDHKSILKLHGWYMADDGNTYLVTPWATHGSIKTYLGKGMQPPHVIIQLIYDIACALQYLHNPKPQGAAAAHGYQQGIVHGAVRPSNILITGKPRALLSDFSSAKFTTENPQAKPYMIQEVTCRYDAPEARDGDFSAASDVYSWAMSALEIASGREPYFEIKYPVALMRLVSTTQERPQYKDHGSPVFDAYPALWRLLELCWSHVKEERPTMSAIVEALKDMFKAQD